MKTGVAATYRLVANNRMGLMGLPLLRGAGPMALMLWLNG
jgi:hypothetical protein